jgi:hypothetical protein
VWATDRLYLITLLPGVEIRLQVRCTDAAFAQRFDALLGRFAVPDGDPASSHLRYSVVAGAAPRRRGQRNYHFLYREWTQITRTLSVGELINALYDDLVAMLPHLVPDLYVVEAGAVARGDEAVLLLGDGPAATRRLMASFCARGYTYVSGTAIALDPVARSWSALPLPLACPDAAAAAELSASGVPLPSIALAPDAGEAFPLYLDPVPADHARGEPAGLAVSMPGERRPAREWPEDAVRALVVETAEAGTAPRVAPLSRARAALRLLQHSTGFAHRAAERPALLAGLLAHAACFELSSPPDDSARRDAHDQAAASVMQTCP